MNNPRNPHRPVVIVKPPPPLHRRPLPHPVIRPPPPIHRPPPPRKPILNIRLPFINIRF